MVSIDGDLFKEARQDHLYISTDNILDLYQISSSNTMSTFFPYKSDISRRKSAPQEVFNTFRSQLQSANMESRPVLITYDKSDRMNNIIKHVPTSFSTLPHKRSDVKLRNNDRRNNRNRHSWIPSSRIDSYGLFFAEGQHVLPSISFGGIRNHRVPYYCNELFCKNEMEENNAKKLLKEEHGLDDNDDQISKKTIIYCEQWF